MNETKTKFPKAALTIVAFEGIVRFLYTSVRLTLPLYLVDVLLFKENETIVLNHVWIASAFLSSIVGGIVSDSWLGKFKTLILCSVCMALGTFLLSLTSIPMLHLPVRELSIFGLFLAAFGYGICRPNMVAFEGDQFTLPQQAKQLTLLFAISCVIKNIGSLSSSFITPVLRKDISCFRDLTCYSLTFVTPAVFVIIVTGVIFFSRKSYRINKPEDNVILKVVKCLFYALSQKMKSSGKRKHWLDYADDKYELKLIEDVKSTLNLVKLFLPMPFFWAVYSSQASLWTFQASRMNGEIAGYLLKPDQIHLSNSLCGILLVPIFHYFVYPVLEKFFFLNTYLRKITVGGLLGALSFYVSGTIELSLEKTYAKTPEKDFSQLRIYNTLDCNVFMTIEKQEFVVEELNMWQNISIPTNGNITLNYRADFRDCRIPSIIAGKFELSEQKANSWAITQEGINYSFEDEVEKSVSNNPRVRALIYIDNNFNGTTSVLKLIKSSQTSKKITILRNLKKTDYVEVIHGVYDLHVNDELVESNVSIKVGGVYTVLGHISETKAVHTVTVTEPNSVHILWLLPQEILLSVSEIMTDVKMLEFTFSQAPNSMKTLLQSLWLFAGFLGNLIVIIFTEAHFFERKAYEIYMYAVLLTISMIIFALIGMFYQYKSVSTFSNEEYNKITENIEKT